MLKLIKVAKTKIDNSIKEFVFDGCHKIYLISNEQEKQDLIQNRNYVKEDFYKLYREKPSELFFIFNRIYHMKSSDKEYGYNLFTQISSFLNKDKINNFFRERYSEKIICVDRFFISFYN